eukprot:CAMPEP_0179071132 /NCGR_PEP_ID=MMETSP0796-20121207/31376_1 /TAXON_ID=73915 /ORGANISM="Pyrodinium bahamense, Strain pbaha01" /LENGTH=302 /DNA_ID=CAMNT_0020768241 /DNA_START=78 /DNA_END=986 /DNA_ORIENTATION=-
MLDGRQIPVVGLGTFMMSEEEAEAAVLAAVGLGYRHIDTAEGYKNEAAVGRALQRCGLPREDIFVTTKLWPGNPAWSQEPKTYASTIKACEESVKQLATGYVDLYLTHGPFCREQRLDQWRAMVELQRRGLCRSIGVSNYGIVHLEEIREAGLPLPACNQIELHPFCLQRELMGYLQKHGILPVAYSSLAPLSGWRTAETDWANGKRDQERQQAVEFVHGEGATTVASVAERCGASPAQLLLRWALQQGYPVLPKSTKAERLASNIDVFGFEISAADMALLKSLDRGMPLAWNNGFNPVNVP